MENEPRQPLTAQERIEDRIERMEPIEGASTCALYVVGALMLWEMLRHCEKYDALGDCLDVACDQLPTSLERLDYCLTKETAWNALSGANDYTVVVNEYPAESYAQAAFGLGSRVYGAILRHADTVAYAGYLLSNVSDVSDDFTPLDVERVKSTWNRVQKSLRELPFFDVAKLMVDIKKEFQRATNGKQLRDDTTSSLKVPIWSSPRSPAEWAKAFRVSWDTLKKRFDDGSIRATKLTTKSYRVHVDDLPK